jgi:hypothetical protein
MYDAVAEGRHSLKVGKPVVGTDYATFPVTFDLTVDLATFDVLTLLANRKDRSVAGVVRRIAKGALQFLVAEEDETVS